MTDKYTIIKEPLHRQVADKLRGSIIKDGYPGQKLESEAGLAKLFSVSVVTVREALSALAQEGLLERRHGSGTFVLEPQKIRNVGVVFSQEGDGRQNSSFVITVAQEVRRILDDANYSTRLYVDYNQPSVLEKISCPAFMRDVNDSVLDAVVAVNVIPSHEWIEPLHKKGIPVIGSSPEYNHYVNHDRFVMAREGVRKLVEDGCKKIALMAWNESLITDKFVEIFRAELAACGLPVYDEWIRRGRYPQSSIVGWEELREIWFARDDKPDGLLVADDVLCMGAVSAIQDIGIVVPDELIIVTHANKGHEIPASIPLLRMEYDTMEFAANITEMLFALESGRSIKTPGISLPFKWADNLISKESAVV